jgi:hypothetical protein
MLMPILRAGVKSITIKSYGLRCKQTLIEGNVEAKKNPSAAFENLNLHPIMPIHLTHRPYW